MRKVSAFAAAATLTAAAVLGFSVSNASATEPAEVAVHQTSEAPPLQMIAGESDILVDPYWTREKLMNATPIEEKYKDDFPKSIDDLLELYPENPPPLDDPEGFTFVVPPASPRLELDPSTELQEMSRSSSMPTHGKVFFRDSTDGEDYVCSGTVVNSGAKTTVATAGHCVHGGLNGKWHENWRFIPGYNNGNTPYGVFFGKVLVTSTAWIDGYNGKPNWAKDAAFVETFTNGAGQKVADVVGANGIAWDAATSFQATAYGYPNAIDGGEYLQRCSDRVRPYYMSGTIVPTMRNCPIYSGMSGGGWMEGVGRNGLGTLKTVTSWTMGNPDDTRPPTREGGPRYDRHVWELYDTADSSTPPRR